jgi:hypothetical protein
MVLRISSPVTGAEKVHILDNKQHDTDALTFASALIWPCGCGV